MMRRRPDNSTAPTDLTLFDGRAYSTAADWMAAWEAFHAARKCWALDHPDGVLPDYSVVGDCPFDPDSI